LKSYKWYIITILLILSVYPPLRGIFAATREIEISPIIASAESKNADPPNPLPTHQSLSSIKTVLSTNDVRAIVLSEARKAGVNPRLALWIASKESQFNPDAVGDNGTSYGIFQIHLPAHPDITIASATDPQFATSWAMRQILAGKVSMWSTFSMCKLWFEDCPF
jgi:hypothetical protein